MTALGNASQPVQLLSPLGPSSSLRKAALLMLAAALLAVSAQIRVSDVWSAMASTHVMAKVKSWHTEPKQRRQVVRGTWTRHNKHLAALPSMFEKPRDPDWDF